MGGVKMPERIKRRNPEAKPAAPASGLTVYDRIETILDALPEDASGFAKDTARNLAVALFREDLERRLGKEARDDA